MEIWILVLLILFSGFFAMSEMSIGASRMAILTQMAEAGNEGARIAAELRNQPSRLLAATQTGLTALATLLGVFGESMWVPRLESVIELNLAWLAFAKYPVALLIVVGGITFASIVVGEIIPKRIALARPETIASLLAPFMAMFAKLNRPFIWALSVTSEKILSLFPFKESAAHVAADEIRAMITAGRRDGGLDETAGELLGNVFRLDDRKVASVMTPANDIIYLDLQAPSQVNLDKIKTQRVSRFLVCKGGLTQLVGYIESRELLQHLLEDEQLDLGKLPTHAIHFIPNTQSLIGVLEFFRQQMTHIAVVVNEFGQAEKRLSLTFFPKLLYKANRAYLFMIRGTIAMYTKDYSAAEIWLNKALETGLSTEGEKGTVYFQLANIAAQKNNWTAAQNQFKKAKEYKVTDPEMKEQYKQFEKALQNRGIMNPANRGMMMQPGGKRKRPRGM